MKQETRGAPVKSGVSLPRIIIIHCAAALNAKPHIEPHL
jgi:hypothetical protein